MHHYQTLFIRLFIFALIAFTFVSTQEEAGYCGYDHKTYSSIEEAHNAGTKIMHCGPCGYCSTTEDVDVYWKTKDNLTKTTRFCAIFGIFSKKLSKMCLDKLVKFTPDCSTCWIDNIMCDTKKCMWTCIWSLIKGEPYVDKDGKLNKCLQCDEDNCGPAFKKCAGANRRRSCIASDILRDKDLICKKCEK